MSHITVGIRMTRVLEGLKGKGASLEHPEHPEPLEPLGI